MLLVKDRKTLEEALPDHTVTWTAFDSGASINTAFLGGAIDLAVIGSSPGRRGSVPAAVHPVSGHRAAERHRRQARRSSCARTPASRRSSTCPGREIAAPFSSTAHYSLLAAPGLAGVDPGAVTIVDLEPQNMQATRQRGDIDGAYVWTPVLSVLQKDAVTLTDSAKLAADGRPMLAFTVARKESSRATPTSSTSGSPRRTRPSSSSSPTRTPWPRLCPEWCGLLNPVHCHAAKPMPPRRSCCPGICTRSPTTTIPSTAPRGPGRSPTICPNSLSSPGFHGDWINWFPGMR